ncbi:MAG: hypothetical protein VX109_03885, partial [Planctomycetota bacterium]|nr:hypothetical protein [Planctomycetota bacterium]
DQANVVGEDEWQEGVPATAPPAARAVGLTLRNSANASNLSVTIAPPAEDRLGGLGNFERPDGGIEGWSAFNQAIAWEGIGREGGALRTVGPLNERYGGSGLERRFDVQAGTILHASVFGRTPENATVRGTKNFGVLRVECLAEDGRVLEWREVRPVDAEQKSGVDGQWHQAKCDMPTPTGTVSGRVVLVFVQPEFEPGTIDFDDLKIHTQDHSLQLHEPFDQVNHTQESWRIQGESRYELDAPLSGTAALFLRSGTELSVPVDLDPSRAVTISLAARGLVDAKLRFQNAVQPPIALYDSSDAGQGWRAWRSNRMQNLPRNAELVVRARSDVLVDAIRVSQPTANAET